MLLTPRYDGPPVLDLGRPAADPAVPLLRQRRRLGARLATLDDDQWAAASRCDGWTVADVVSHLVTVTGFFAISIGAGRAGSPTRFLTTFDPVTSPDELVAAARGTAPADLLAQYDAAVEGLADAIAGLDLDGWLTPAEAPPGHISAYGVALHALWDAWVHELDIALPLGLESVIEADEVTECVRYAAVLGPAFLAAADDGRTGTLVIESTDPAACFTVAVGPTVTARSGSPADDVEVTATVRATGVELLDGLSFRTPLAADVAPGGEWILSGLATVFDRVP